MSKMKINSGFVPIFLFKGIFCCHTSSPALFSELLPLYVRSHTLSVVSLGVMSRERRAPRGSIDDTICLSHCVKSAFPV